MKKTILLAATVALLTERVQAESIVIFTDRDDFEAAAGFDLSQETFDHIAKDISFSGGSATADEITVSTQEETHEELNEIGAPRVLRAIEGDDTAVPNAFTQAGASRSISFAHKIFAAGAGVFSFNDGQIETVVSILAEAPFPRQTQWRW
ncbi:MAG: hypothetical protein ACFB11_22615 [Paracoccaceae bacterium]